MYGFLIFVSILVLIFYFFKGVFILIKPILPFILIYYLVTYIYKQIFPNKYYNKRKKQNTNKSSDEDVIDVEYEEVE